jgi:hypothetical protein
MLRHEFDSPPVSFKKFKERPGRGRGFRAQYGILSKSCATKNPQHLRVSLPWCLNNKHISVPVAEITFMPCNRNLGTFK